MIFHEIYSVYYQTVAKILEVALDHPLKKDEICKIIEKYAFSESVLSIEPALREQKWQLIRSDGTTVLKNHPSMPLTTIQKRWLKSICQDPRIHLFQDDLKEIDFPEIEPLFTLDDFYIFDQYQDGDDYTDKVYIRNFRMILDAIKNQYPLEITTYNHKGQKVSMKILPKYLEYSEKDDKFRVAGFGSRLGGTVNLGRIISCERAEISENAELIHRIPPRKRRVIFELKDERNALERALLHFAHFPKKAERIERNQYQITIDYDKDDETEMVIRILSFGPMFKVVQPDHFVNLIKERLRKQKSSQLFFHDKKKRKR